MECFPQAVESSQLFFLVIRPALIQRNRYCWLNFLSKVVYPHELLTFSAVGCRSKKQIELLFQIFVLCSVVKFRFVC